MNSPLLTFHHRHRLSRATALLLLIFFSLLLSGCGTLSYYSQAIKGHFEVMEKAKPIDDLLADPNTDLKLKAQLRRSQEIRGYAVNELHLPDNNSYQFYSNLGRDYVTWVVIAAPEFSVEPKRWCFAVVGCLSYRGYFRKKDAETLASRLRSENLDVDLAGSRAYSTLGWFDDPVLNTLIGKSETGLAEVIFHELAHQKLYIKDDTAFNEAFAVAVSRHGVRTWLLQNNKPQAISRYTTDNRRDEQFQRLLLDTRSKLIQIYANNSDITEMRKGKQAAFAAMKRNYDKLKSSWGGYSGYDQWMSQDLNNAHLALVATYHKLAPDFTRLIKTCNNDLTRFYRHVNRLVKLEPRQRRERLRGDNCR